MRRLMRKKMKAIERAEEAGSKRNNGSPKNRGAHDVEYIEKSDVYRRVSNTEEKSGRSWTGRNRAEKREGR
jgi:hypothetical protein